MNISKNSIQQSNQNDKIIINQLKEKKDIDNNITKNLNIEKELEKDDFNQSLISNIGNKEKMNINDNNYDSNKKKSNMSINKNEITIESNKIKILNHNIVPECINNCINWTLRAHINKKSNQKDFKSYYTFQGKNLFFPKLDYSILNAMNNSSCFEKCFPKNNSFENKKKALEKLKQESISQLNKDDSNNTKKNDRHLSENASLKNILEFKFPIDNSKNNFNIIDNNLCLSENLNNVFLLKFDLKNGINNNNFRQINDNCVEREVEFRLNGDFHGNKIFSNDLYFTVTYRDFIKAIQFRLDNFKSKILAHNYNRKYGENKNYHSYHSEDKNQKKFYGKMINNVNIGIEFYKPQSFNQLQTNFNSIVNSEIELTKIFIELTIPKKLIKPKNGIENNKEGNLSNNKIGKTDEEYQNNNEEEKNKNIDSKEPKLYIPPPPPFMSQKLYIPPPPPTPASWANLNLYNMRISNQSEIPIPPPFAVFNSLIYKKDYPSNTTPLRNQLVYNNKFPNVTFDYISINNNYHKSPSLSVDLMNTYSSPTSVNCNYSPMSASYLMIQPMTYFGGIMNSPFGYSNYSSPYLKKNLNFKNLNQRKYSGSYNQDLFDNLRDNLNKKYEDDLSSLNLQQSITSKSLNDTDISSSGNQNNQFKKMKIMTIKQRIIDSFKKQEKENDKKNNRINKNDNGQNAKNLMRELRDTFVLTNQGKTNFEIFIESVTPKYLKNSDFPFLKLKIIDIFYKFKKISLFGLKNTYTFNGELITSSYLLSLSTLSIKIINKSLMNNITQALQKDYEVLKQYNNLKQDSEIAINISQYTIYFSLDYIQICFSENKPFQHRNPFIKTISDISKLIPYFDQITIEDINLIDSLFSILYSPLKCSKLYINYTSFIVYYQFTKEVMKEDNINKNYLYYDKQTITGVLPLKINTNLYFQRIIIYNFVMNISPLLNYFSPYFNNDTMMIKNMVYSVINDVSKHIRGVSYDYEYFLKLSKHNSFNPWN